MLLGQRRMMDSKHIMLHVAKDDIFVRFVHDGKGCALEFAVRMVYRRRARLLVADKMTKFRMEDECIIACIDRHVASRPALRRI